MDMQAGRQAGAETRDESSRRRFRPRRVPIGDKNNRHGGRASARRDDETHARRRAGGQAAGLA